MKNEPERSAEFEEPRGRASEPSVNTNRNGTGSRWALLSNHAHVLVCLARDPSSRLREVAFLIGITERAVQKIVHDLVEEGLLERYRDGRRNRYDLRLEQPLRHPLEAHRAVRDLVDFLNQGVPGVDDSQDKPEP